MTNRERAEELALDEYRREAKACCAPCEESGLSEQSTVAFQHGFRKAYKLIKAVREETAAQYRHLEEWSSKREEKMRKEWELENIVERITKDKAIRETK